MTLKWVPGTPSGPTKQVYYATAKHAGGDFTICVTYHNGVAQYGLSRGGKWIKQGFTDKRVAVAHAEGIVAAEEIACQA